MGQAGEEIAVRYLLDSGMDVVERNWRCEHGEVDVVAVDGDYLVICEVKTRRSLAFGEPVEAVTRAKAARLRRLAAAYVRGHETGWARVRIDVLGILFRAGEPPVVRHVRGVGS
ncbi:MAG TPA: YraN family protein [Ornithinibacter sp.]|nr:YraN family protein [Ornithinibacter sp.]